jgi:hypothetical protein
MDDQPHGGACHPIQSVEKIVERHAITLNFALSQMNFHPMNARLSEIVVADDAVALSPMRESRIFRPPSG